MPVRTKDQNTYVHGSHNELCEICGMKFKTEDMLDRWDGLRVCKQDWEERHPMDFFRGTPDFQDVDNPDSDDAGQGADNSATDVGGNTFPDTSDANGALTPVPVGTNFGNEVL